MRFLPAGCLLAVLTAAGQTMAAGGSLTLTVQEEATGEPTITRVEISRADSPERKIPIRKSVPAGIGVVLDRELELSLADAEYQFRMIRGPEYRIITGRFSLERTSLDRHSVQLPRMVDMLQKGWTSGDCCVPTSPYSLSLRMAAEDLHLAAVLGHVEAKPIPGRSREDLPKNDPSWIREDVRHQGGLVFYGPSQQTTDHVEGKLPVEDLVDAAANDEIRVAIENPFAWPLPVWLASQQIDGVFVLGDWLRLDRSVTSIRDGRGPMGPAIGDKRSLGRWAERIYWNMLESGLRIPPLAGSGDDAQSSPVGYNRLYVADSPDDYEANDNLLVRRVTSEERWWRAAWLGQSVATNGPLLRPMLGGKLPGHVFQAAQGEVLQLQPELTLAVRDPVEYLEVIHNGKVHYSARLDEFAKAGGVIPPIMVKESSWVTMRVMTLHEDHFRAAMSAPWYVDFDSKPRVTTKGVEFFRRWLREYEQRLKRLPPEEIKRHIPYVRAARSFWTRQLP